MFIVLSFFEGLIPAHAGKTGSPRSHSNATAAHPRSRGENGGGSIHGHAPIGSSPLTRGKRGMTGATSLSPGLIPAHAGKTGIGWGPGRAGRAHPRSRGENSANCGLGGGDEGSSPLTRGKRAVQDGHALGGGSSPLTRGKHHAASPLTEVEGLIPAHAGKTRPRGRSGLQRRAHPRSRGENRWFPSFSPSLRGSSPLTRGKPPTKLSFVLMRGLIPAHAGKTRDCTPQPD